MSIVEDMAAFAQRFEFTEIAQADRERFKIHILDTIGCAIGALRGEPVLHSRRVVDQLGGNAQCTLIGGGKTSLPNAAFYNGVLVRYLDFMDAYLADNGECHPSDTFASVLAAAELNNRSGRDFIAALATSYQMICRLSHDVDVMHNGFDHTTTITFAMAAGVSRLLGLDMTQTVNALAIAGADCAGPMANRTEPISNWKGMATGECASRTLLCVLLAREGVTGPHELFEGPGGLQQMTREKWAIDWSKEKLDIINQVMIKKYNGEARSQSAIDALLELRRTHNLRADAIKHVRIDTFRPAYDNLGGGKYGPKDDVHSKEQADHNLKYMAAAALLDGDVWPAQYAPERIVGAHIQALMQRVDVEPKLTFTWRDPQEQPTRVSVTMSDGKTVKAERSDFEGFPTHPMSWDRVAEKFERLVEPHADVSLRQQIMNAVSQLDQIQVGELTSLLARVRT